MIGELIPQEPNVISTTHSMDMGVEIPVTINNETHNFGLTCYYDEKDNDSAKRELYGHKVEGQCRHGESADIGESMSECIHDWFDDNFDGNYSDKDYDELFEKVWEFLTDENLV